MTDAEKLLWHLLRREQMGVKFRRQHSIGGYIADFACLSPKLVIELDGGQHAEEAHSKKDETRTRFMEKQGFEVLRFWNTDVLQNTEGVLETIYHIIHGKHGCPLPNPPPTGEGAALAPTTHRSPLLQEERA